MKITVLCKVVDNFGDIGVAWRLVKQLKSINRDCKIALVVDDLVSFNKINEFVDFSTDFQVCDGIEIYDWNAFHRCYRDFSENDGEKLEIILELFQCGRPDWMEKILFEDKLEKTVHVIMIDYLSAEKYAEEFHCLQSLTRSAKVQKINFMPGFTQKTGGLIIDDDWKNMPDYNPDGDVLFFCYDRNWTPLKNAMVSCEGIRSKKILIAQGKGKKSFLESKITAGISSELDCKKKTEGKNCFNMEKSDSADLKIEELLFLNQNEWDSVMKKSSILFIRGEESLSRACISGIPFIWHAYPQSNEYQLVKVNALIERMERHFCKNHFTVIKNLMTAFNQSENSENDEKMQACLEEFFCDYENYVEEYQDFAMSLRKNGDLATNLMTFIEKNYIMQ